MGVGLGGGGGMGGYAFVGLRGYCSYPTHISSIVLQQFGLLDAMLSVALLLFTSIIRPPHLLPLLDHKTNFTCQHASDLAIKPHHS